MNTASKVAALCAGAAGIITGTMLVEPVTAAAASYGDQCGGGYHVIDQRDVKGGTVFLAYNGSRNCVVTVRDHPGGKEKMRAELALSGWDGVTAIDAGDYTTYAGPVYMGAKGDCIDWSGDIGDSSAGENNSHCG
ncbi:hypothetical protein [Nocardia australiensis]|uniref:hypothetical protein n=1 Tax=Nocardia australiensis TaxID=2887191 RepID=UPI001D15C790|nr:hypothetical protein [Nocardia australiensis]